MLLQSLFDIIREAQKRREKKRAAEQAAIAKSEEIVTKAEEKSKRPESHWAMYSIT